MCKNSLEIVGYGLEETILTASTMSASPTMQTCADCDDDPAWIDKALASTMSSLSLISMDSALLASNDSCPSSMTRSQWKMSDYITIAKLHSGSLSTVYLAKCNVSGLYVVLKIYSPQTHPFLTHQLEREINIHIRMNHKNITQLHAAFSDRGKIVLVQEYVKSRNLLDFLKHHHVARLHESDVVRKLLPQILGALRYMHERCIVHRDIKMENILICNTGLIKICDFGVSIDLSQESAVTRCGTENTMAPEVKRCPMKSDWRDNKDDKDYHYNYSSDVWSVGALTYQLIVGVAPLFSNDNPIPKFPLHMGYETKDMITACLNRTPVFRPSTQCLIEFIQQYRQRINNVNARSCVGSGSTSSPSENSDGSLST